MQESRKSLIAPLSHEIIRRAKSRPRRSDGFVLQYSIEVAPVSFTTPSTHQGLSYDTHAGVSGEFLLPVMFMLLVQRVGALATLECTFQSGKWRGCRFS